MNSKGTLLSFRFGKDAGVTIWKTQNQHAKFRNAPLKDSVLYLIGNISHARALPAFANWYNQNPTILPVPRAAVSEPQERVPP